MNQQITDRIMMVRPAHFGFNTETAGNNAFQDEAHGLSAKKSQTLALAEFDQFVEKLRAAGIQVSVIEDTGDPVKNDAIFPNNWITTHADGTIVTYPMYSEMRRLERREDVVDGLQDQYRVHKRVHLEQRESLERYLEGTGSMILDRPNRLVYACRSIRTDEQLLDELCLWLDYKKVLFDAYDDQGMPIYHTNVMMALGTTFAVICMDSITDTAQRDMVAQQLAATDKEIIDISLAQMGSFAGNMIQLRGGDTDYLVMSSQAFESLNEDQIEEIQRHTNILHSPIPTIEQLGGGSARCMIAENFLPSK